MNISSASFHCDSILPSRPVFLRIDDYLHLGRPHLEYSVKTSRERRREPESSFVSPHNKMTVLSTLVSITDKIAVEQYIGYDEDLFQTLLEAILEAKNIFSGNATFTLYVHKFVDESGGELLNLLIKREDLTVDENFALYKHLLDKWVKFNVRRLSGKLSIGV